MDVDDTDLPSNAAETSLVPIETHELGDGIFVTVVDGGKDTQAQWDVVFSCRIFSPPEMRTNYVIIS